MNCCLLLSGLRSMECLETGSSSRVQTLSRTKLSQVMSRSLSSTADKSDNPLTLSPDYTKLPELDSDKDIEDVLCKISELLTSNSVISSAPQLSDSRSIEEILREAEEIVRDSSSYFEDEGVVKSGRGEAVNGDNLSDKTECSLELEQEQSRHGSSKQDDISRGVDPGSSVRFNGYAVDTTSPAVNPAVTHTGTTPSTTAFAGNPKPLTLKDLETPDRPTNLDLSLEVIHVERIKATRDSLETTPVVSLPQTINLPKSHESSSCLDVSELNNSLSIEQISVINNKNHPLTMPSTAVKIHLTESNCIIDTKSKALTAKPKDKTSDKELAGVNERKSVRPGGISSDPLKRRQIPILHNNRPKSVPAVNSDDLKKVYEEKIFSLEQQIRILSAKLSELEKSDEEERRGRSAKESSDSLRLALLEKEIQDQEQLIAGYQKENQKLLADTSKARNVWLEAEKRLQEKVMRLERDLKRANDLNITEALELREALTDARQEINRLEEEAAELRNERRDLEKEKMNMKDELKRLRCDWEKLKSEAEELRAKDKERERRLTAEHSLASATLQGRLSQANTQLSHKQSEVVRLTSEITRLRGELERARLGSVVSGESPGSGHSASHQVRQLEMALERERENSRRALNQLDSSSKHNLDLARQVKELEMIVKRRSKCGGGILWGDEDGLRLRESLESRTRKLEQELAAKDRQLSEHQAKLSDLQNKYEKDVSNLQEKVKETNKRGGSTSSVRSNQRNASQNANSDAQLLATIRGLKAEMAAKDKQLTKLSRELDDTKKKMSRSQSQFSHSNRSLNNNRPHSKKLGKCSV